MNYELQISLKFVRPEQSCYMWTDGRRLTHSFGKESKIWISYICNKFPCNIINDFQHVTRCRYIWVSLSDGQVTGKNTDCWNRFYKIDGRQL